MLLPSSKFRLHPMTPCPAMMTIHGRSKFTRSLMRIALKVRIFNWCSSTGSQALQDRLGICLPRQHLLLHCLWMKLTSQDSSHKGFYPRKDQPHCGTEHTRSTAHHWGLGKGLLGSKYRRGCCSEKSIRKFRCPDPRVLVFALSLQSGNLRG